MNRPKSMSLNAAVNGLRTLVQVLFPLITYPYASRILQVENLGRFDFASSIVSYASLFAGLGIATYAVREGARYRDDREAMSRFASEVFTINVCSMLLSYLVLFVAVEFLSDTLKGYAALIFVLGISIAFTTIGCEWVYTIYEEYVYIAIRGTAFQLLSMVLLFTLVHTREDLLIYAMITVISLSGSGLVNRIGLHRFCRVRLTRHCHPARHLRPILVLFSNTVTTTIYTVSDTTILGYLTSDYYVGLYAVSTRVYVLVKQLLAAIIIVSVPRLSYLLGRGEREAFTALARRILSALLLVTLPCVAGLIALRREIVLFLSAPSFAPAQYSLGILGVALLFSLFSWFYTSCVLIPAHRENRVLLSTVAAALLNIALNLLLIPHLQERAAALTTALAELCSMLLCFAFSGKVETILPRRQDLLTVLAGCLWVLAVCAGVQRMPLSPALTLLVAIACSVAGYVLLLRLCKNDTLEFLLQSLRRRA